MGKRETDSTIFLGTHDKVIVNPDNDTKNQSKWQHNVQEGTLGEKISQYVEIHRKNWFDVRIQELVSKVQFSGGFFHFFWSTNPEMCRKVGLLTWNFGSKPKTLFSYFYHFDQPLTSAQRVGFFIIG